MELKQIKELMSVMQRTGTKRLVIKREGVELELEREDRPQRVMNTTVDLLDDNPMKLEMAQHRANMMLSRGGEMTSSLGASVPASQKNTAEDPNSAFILSPM